MSSHERTKMPPPRPPPPRAVNGSFGSKCEELKVRKASLQYPNDQTLFGRCEKFRRRPGTDSCTAAKTSRWITVSGRFLHCHEGKPTPALLSFRISPLKLLTFLLPEDANLRKEIGEYLELLFGVR